MCKTNLNHPIDEGFHDLGCGGLKAPTENLSWLWRRCTGARNLLGHFDLPLPWHSEIRSIINNKVCVIQTLLQLRDFSVTDGCYQATQR